MLTKLDLMDKGTNALDVIFLSPYSMFPVLLFMLYIIKFLKSFNSALYNHIISLPCPFFPLKVLEGRSYRLQHPWVGVVNRSQADINKNVDMIVARRKESEYFETSPDYGHLANKMGSVFLAKLLSQVCLSESCSFPFFN